MTERSLQELATEATLIFRGTVAQLNATTVELGELPQPTVDVL
jgi:hypothetical protein